MAKRRDLTEDDKTAVVFNEWLRQYQADPDGFSKTDHEAQVLVGESHDYGQRCVRTMQRIRVELKL